MLYEEHQRANLGVGRAHFEMEGNVLTAERIGSVSAPWRMLALRIASLTAQ
jgi:hypothetical protein